MNYYLIKYKWNPFEPINDEKGNRIDPYRTGKTLLVSAMDYKEAKHKIKQQVMKDWDDEGKLAERLSPESFQFEDLTIK